MDVVVVVVGGGITPGMPTGCHTRPALAMFTSVEGCFSASSDVDRSLR